MKSSLIPEKPILVYPSLAATVGLEESILLSTLSDFASSNEGRHNNGYAWHQVSVSQLLASLPFWDARELQRISTNLREKGIIIIASAPILQSEEFKFAFNERANATAQSTATQPATVQPAPTAQPTAVNSQHAQRTSSRAIPVYSQASNLAQPSPGGFLSKNFIAPNWQPDQDTLAQLAQHNINAEFAYQHVPEFVTYWRERGEAHHSWGAKFISHCIREWRKFESIQHQKQSEVAMNNTWRPSTDAIEIMTQQAEIPLAFIEDAIPEFILYWQERGDKLKTWNSKFIQHVRLQWKKYHSAVESQSDPKPIAANWQPSEDVFDVLRLANIDLAFAQSLIPEFVLYWRDSRQVHTSWNTRYLQHVKRQWANRHALSTNQQAQGANQPNRSTREISLEEQLNDRSWAN